MYIRLPQAFNQTHETIQSGLDRVVFLFVIEFFLVPILSVQQLPNFFEVHDCG